MTEKDDSTRQFLHDCRNNPQALRNYANLLYGGLAKIPGIREKTLNMLYSYVDKCPTCGSAVGQKTKDCVSCTILLDRLIEQTRIQYNKAKNKGFYCVAIGAYSLQGLPEAK